jgi:hypothetical protein
MVSFATISFHSFWAQFGWMAIPAPSTLYWAWGALTLLGLAGLILRRHMLRQPPWLLLVGTIIAAWLAYVGYNFVFLQFQGRYLFPALVPLATLVVAGWTAWLPARLRVTGALLLGGVLLGLNAYALLRVLGPGFSPVG